MSKNIWLGFIVAVLGLVLWQVGAPVQADVVAVDRFGFLAQSGDGGDFLPDGTAASVIPAGSIPWSSPAPCGLQWIADNPKGLSPNPPPSVVHFTRKFRVTSRILSAGVFVLTFKADDQVTFYLNGQALPVASCTPPAGNDGECQQHCHMVVIPSALFRPDPEDNELKIDLTNLFNVPVGKDFGWTSLTYSLRVQATSDPLPEDPAAPARPKSQFFESLKRLFEFKKR
jgi:hypothetical protein